jgi:hypothetical protein
MKLWLAGVMLYLATGALAAVYKTEWSTQPMQPLYPGQRYQLCLTLESDAAEEITGFHLQPSPGMEVLEDLLGEPKITTHTSQVGGERRVTKLFFSHAKAKAIGVLTIPSLRAEVTLSQRFQQGIFTTTHSMSHGITIPAYTFAVEALKEEAKGLPIGDYTASMELSQTTIAAGGVVQVTATIVAEDGFIPQDLLPTFKGPDGCKLYAPTVWERTSQSLVVTFYCVSDARPTVSIEMDPVAYFDTKTRSVQSLKARPVTFTTMAAKEATYDVQLPSGERVYPLRYAPSEHAPMVGWLPLEVEVGQLQVLENQGVWRLVSYNGQRGWFREPQMNAKGRP